MFIRNSRSDKILDISILLTVWLLLISEVSDIESIGFVVALSSEPKEQNEINKENNTKKDVFICGRYKI